MHINGLAWTEAETSLATATWDAARCRIWGNRVGSAMSATRPLYLRMCCKTIFTTRMSNIDSRTSTSARRRFKNTVHLDSIIARSQRSKEFCNTIRFKADVAEPLLTTLDYE